MVFNLPTANFKKQSMDIESDEDDNSNLYDKSSQIFKARFKVNRQKSIATQLTDFSTLSLDRIL